MDRIGSASHLAGVVLGDMANIELQHVPYRGGAPALIDLLAGHVNTMFLSPVIGLENIKAGKLGGSIRRGNDYAFWLIFDWTSCPGRACMRAHRDR